MNAMLKKIHDIGIVPVIALDDANLAVPLAKALVAGGLPAAEVTFRTAAAEDAIRAIAAEVPEMVLGAGTVLTREQLDRALDAGAQFIVSPGFNPELVKYGLSKGALMLPGTATAGEMEQAMMLGLDAVKFFPAEQNGGIAKLKALAGPYQSLLWMPTGGVSTKNLKDYAAFDQILACGGTWMVKKDLIQGQRWDEITAICRDAVRELLGYQLEHIGLNCENAEEAEATAKLLCGMFGLNLKDGNSSIFCSRTFECMKTPYLGTHGHIAISVYNVDRAMYHLSRSGIVFREETRSVDAKGNTKSIYLQNEIAGFAFHLVKR